MYIKYDLTIIASLSVRRMVRRMVRKASSALKWVSTMGYSLGWRAERIEAEWRIYESVNNAIIGLDNDLSPDRREAIIWINAGILFIWPLETQFNDIFIKYNYVHSRKCVWKCRLQSFVYFISASMR